MAKVIDLAPRRRAKTSQWLPIEPERLTYTMTSMRTGRPIVSFDLDPSKSYHFEIKDGRIVAVEDKAVDG